ncbi:MAG: twin-arginine translocase TatA/TatE family subunit [Candidatus Competibacteraceae bacterium]|nr:twin-arginine translocase TatA/TatE family subunit [Candidatus Competibacteraceae bacterium]
MLISFLMGQFGPWQVVLVIAVVLLLFGGRKIPELMKGLGRGVKEFKDGIKGEEEAKEKGEKQIKE